MVSPFLIPNITQPGRICNMQVYSLVLLYKGLKGSFFNGKEDIMDTPITRAEHDEFAKRQDEENKRQNRRIDALEEMVREISSLTASVAKLASSMESMLKEQERQGERLEALEGRDGEMWRKVTGYIITAVTGIVLGFIFTRIGM